MRDNTQRSLSRARHMRAASTEAEDVLWQTIRSRRLDGLKFRRQVPIGPYIVDFLCTEHRLVIEVDGSRHGEPGQIEHDARRDAWLRNRGYDIVRFWNDDVSRDLDSVCTHILKVLGRV